MANTTIPVELSSTPGIVDNSNATAITIDSSENVGIGTASPNNYANLTTLTIDGTNGSVLDFESGGTLTGEIFSSSASLAISFKDDSDCIFYGNTTERMRITNSGNTLLQTGGAALQWQNGYQTITGDAASNDLTYRTYANHIWKTTTGASSTTDGIERMRLDNAGRVFIGSTASLGGADFSYTGPAGSDTTLQIMCPDNTPGREIQLRLTNNSGTYYTSGAAFRSVQGGGINSYTLYVETNNTGGVYLPGGSTSWSSVSDERYKTIIEDIDNASQKVSTLRTVIGTFNEDPESKRRPFLIAQDVQAVLPEAVDDTADPNKLGLSYTDVIPLLAAAIKEQHHTIESLTARITALES